MQHLTLHSCEGTVKLVDQYPLYELGAVLRKLQDEIAKEGTEAFELMLALLSAATQVRGLLDGTPVEISYCRETATRLLQQMNDVINLYRDKESGHFRPDADRPERWQLSGMQSSIEIFEHQFSAELKKTVVYAVPRRGIFDTERLVDGADAHLAPVVKSIFPDFVSTEFRAAGRCFAFGLFSASAFHALRAAEKSLRIYYKAILGEPRKDAMTMGLMASHLRDRLEHKDGGLIKPRIETLRTIQDVTTYDRNPLTHKELDLREDDAAMLFNRAHGMISMMALELSERAQELSKLLGNGSSIARHGAATKPKGREQKNDRNDDPTLSSDGAKQ